MAEQIKVLEKFKQLYQQWKFTPDEQNPIRAEFFAPEKLIEQARILALAQEIQTGTPPKSELLKQFQKNSAFLHDAYGSVNAAAVSGDPIPPAEEWFVDNFHVIADQLAGIKEDLPKKFYVELPALGTGTLRGYPRTYEMALQLIAHTDSRLDPQILRDYIRSYQSVSPLTTGELWAIAILLRVGLIENLKRLILVSDRERGARKDANRFAERLIGAKSNEEIQAVLKERERDPRRIGGAFAVQLILRLRDEPPAHFQAVEWLYDRLLQSGMDPDEMIRRKHHDIAAAQVSVSNLIQSLRLLATMDWSELVEDVSLVDAELRKDPSGHYSSCDFATRDRYRHVIEEISKKSAKSEIEIATLAIQLAANSKLNRPTDDHGSHVGYYLIQTGRRELERVAGFKPGFRLAVRRSMRARPVLFYQMPILAMTVLFVTLLCSYAANLNGGTEIVVFLLYLIPASALAVLITNWLVISFLKPNVLPKLELKDGIPQEYRTFVVLPCLLLNPEEVRQLASRLEVTYLANSEDVLDFALLSDFADSQSEISPEDEALLAEARDEIAELNLKYPRSEGPRFHMFHRKRLWNESEGKWMGWERKRGKLEEFNRLLLGSQRTSYLHAELPSNVKYVITLDADTILPRDSARKLIGTLAHPLNSAVLDPYKKQVVEGYGILQPRVSHTLISANQSWFSRIHSGHAGIDPYTTAVSDIYQDLFREASYVGKGIYNLAAFSAATDPRFPENRLLSHDLVEGAFARTGLVSDIEIFDDHPSDYTSYIMRLHRWVRGDWQAAPWILPRVPGPEGKRIPNTLSWLNRWKLFDNLRRSLVSPALFLCLLFGWTVLPGLPIIWSAAVLGVLFAPLFIQFVSGVLSPPGKARWVGRLWGLLYDAGFNLLQSLLQLSFLPNEAWLMTDAIVRTLWRMIRKKKMLEWTTAAQAEKMRGKEFHHYVLRLRGALLLTGATGVIVTKFAFESLPVALPFFLLWMASPLFAFLTGQSTPRQERKIGPAMVPVLRSYAREIWRFFETLVIDETHWLPPDKFQEMPEPIVAPRTSPTNIGFLLLSNIAAYDLGYIGAVEFVDRTERTLETLSQLKTFNGHLFNWYSTTDLQPLEPRYVSTVDSGNLAAALIVLKQFALRFALNVQKSFEPRTGRYEGVRDTLGKFLQLAMGDAEFEKKNRQSLQQILRLINVEPHDTAHQEKLLQELMGSVYGIPDHFAGVRTESGVPPALPGELEWWWNASKHIVATHRADYERPQDIASRLLSISRDADQLTQEIDFRFLFNEKRGVFAIGFNVTNGQLDRSYYDLFASEARLASFVAIAKGDVPQSHWFRMSRAMTSFGRRRILVSWSGSMFEYLMPLLFLSNEPKTLLDVTYRGAVDLQRMYGLENAVPWGISEAAYNARDLSQNYQYGPFGVPSLGLKRGLARDLVVAPYATFLASMVRPRSAFRNLDHLKRMGAHGKFGFYESVDFTKDRIPKEEKYAVVRTFMAHHQGMSLVALDNLLHKDIIQRRFGAEPAAQATALLLQEKMPLAVRPGPMHVVDERFEIARIAEPSVAREFRSPFVTPPRTQLLSNGKYLLMMTTGGSGFSELEGIRLNRWREDVTRDPWGSFLYIRDLKSHEFWSAGFVPTLKVPDDYRVVFAEDQVEIRRRDGSVETLFDVSVSPEDNVEIRRVILVNSSDELREIDITSYLEVVLNAAAADLAHPAFSNLFVETHYLPEIQTLLASRRPRSSDETAYWAGHVMICEDPSAEINEYETDRARFIGRNRSVINPQALSSSAPLSGTVGAVLDPIFSLRCKVRIEPYSRQVIAVMTMIGRSREEVTTLAEKYRDGRAVHRSKELAAIHAQIGLSQASISRDEADLFQRIAGRLIYSDLSLRPRPAVLLRNNRTQSALWKYGISGDLPICLVRIEDATEIDMVRQLLRAHDYWRSKGFVVDLVILNEYPSSYFQELQQDLLGVIRSSTSYQRMDVPGGIFLRQADLMPEEDRILLRTVARVEISAQRGSLARQVARGEAKDLLTQRYVPLSQYPIIDPPLPIPVPDLILNNGFGGFTTDGKEYVIALNEGDTTPAPWINVIANPEFGFQISESGAGMTWSANSHENRLTPWSNDAVSDPVDCSIYIRDEESGIFWSPTPQPSPAKGNYVVAHGAGYTRFNYGGYGLEQELLLFVPPNSSVKVMKLRLRNPSRRSRRLSVTSFTELTLGVTRSQATHFVVTSIDSTTGALLATNSYNNEFAGRVAFLWMNDKKRTVSGDRTTFLGPSGNLQQPAAMCNATLSGKVGAGLDPCAAMRGEIRLSPLSEQTVIFLFGEGKDVAEAQRLIQSLNTVEAVEAAYQDCYDCWNKQLNSIQVKTPDPIFDLMMNRWLLYQTYSCRFFSRSAFYQSGGAFGYRDQLQDAMAFVYSDPGILREHLLRCAGHQFLEGDVQHWWHPPTGRGVRTRSSDDLLWLPYCAAFYVRATGDTAVLDETAPYLEAPLLAPEQMEAYQEPVKSKISGSLYEHCVKAIEYSLKFGAHDLPLIGSGDWNDGMNRLGIEGRGESVWLAWFQIDILNQFAEICEARYDHARAEHFRKTAASLAAAVERHGWDGEWYRRGFDDDGIPFGSAENQECRIDSIAQSWAVLSHSADVGRARMAMKSVDRMLIRSKEQLALLFTPPFVNTPRDPGYIKGYPAGIRENGGHYNHAATWLIAAFAELGMPDKALELFHLSCPIIHSSNRETAENYKVEPYAAVGDIYSHPSHIGRGGWSWYTGSAGWLYRVCLEWILGFRLQGNQLKVDPSLPVSWPGYELTFRQGTKLYHVTVSGKEVKVDRQDVELAADQHT
jgi:cyclic beta-1,2-glucan synthetase